MQEGSEKAVAAGTNAEKSPLEKTLLERFWLPVILGLIGLATTALTVFGSHREGSRDPERQVAAARTSSPAGSEEPVQQPATPAAKPPAVPAQGRPFPVLARLASTSVPVDGSSCKELLTELEVPSVGLRSIEYSAAHEQGEWAHQCDLEESGYRDADELAAIINGRLEERVTSRLDGKERVWEWPLGGVHLGSYLELTARGKKPLELRVAVPDAQR